MQTRIRTPRVWKKQDILSAPSLEATPEKSGYTRLTQPGIDSTTTIMVASFEKIFPGKDRSAHDAHAHQYEEIILILKGKGYSILGEKRYDWEEGDVISLPSLVSHQHFNLDPKNETLFIAVKSSPLLNLLGLPQTATSAPPSKIQ